MTVKRSDKAEQWESEEIYSFLVCTVCSVSGDYEAGMLEWGFLFPAFSNRSTDVEGINLCSPEGNMMILLLSIVSLPKQTELVHIILYLSIM